MAGNHRHFRGLGPLAAVSCREFFALRPFRRGFRAPVSARFFPISVSGEGRRVRLLPETGSGLTAAPGGSTRMPPQWSTHAARNSLLGDVAKLRLSGRSHGADARENA
jgi:hypothetical protein